MHVMRAERDEARMECYVLPGIVYIPEPVQETIFVQKFMRNQLLIFLRDYTRMDFKLYGIA